MRTYRWKGIFKDGKPCSGKLEAQSCNQVKDILLGQEIALLDCSQSVSLDSNVFKYFLTQRFLVKKITFKQLQPFFEHLSILLKSGIPLRSSLKISGQQEAIQSLQDTIKQISLDVERGSSLANALRQHPTIFTPFITHLIDAGEHAGKLDLVCENLSAYFKRRRELEKKIKQATLLPCITLGFALCIFVIIFALIIPQFSTLFTSLNKPLPALTKTVLALSTWFTGNFVVLCSISIVVCVIVIKKILHLEKIKKYTDALVLKIPIVSSIVLLTNIVRFLQIVSMFLKSGIPLATAFEKAGNSLHNAVLRKTMEQAHQAIMQGKSLEQAFSEKNNSLPPEVIALMGVGEQTGTLELMLDKASDFLQEKLSAQLELLTTVIQPILLIITGIIIASLMLAVYLPIFSMASLL